MEFVVRVQHRGMMSRRRYRPVDAVSMPDDVLSTYTLST